MYKVKSFKKFISEAEETEETPFIEDDVDFHKIKKSSDMSGNCEEISQTERFAIAQDNVTIKGYTVEPGDYVILGNSPDEAMPMEKKDFEEKYKNVKYTNDEMTLGTAEKITQQYEYAFPGKPFKIKIDDTQTSGNEFSFIIRLDRNTFDIMDKDEFKEKYDIV